jgi:hypothetical protein
MCDTGVCYLFHQYLDYVWERGCGGVPKNFKIFFIKIEYGLYVLDRFDVLMSKMILKK